MQSPTTSNLTRTWAAAAAVWARDVRDTLRALGSVAMGVGICLFILAVVASWFAVEAVQGFTGVSELSQVKEGERHVVYVVMCVAVCCCWVF